MMPRRLCYDDVKDDKDDKDDSIMTPRKDDKQDQWWDSSSSEYVVDTTITNDTNG